jgi:hypothetical protein
MLYKGSRFKNTKEVGPNTNMIAADFQKVPSSDPAQDTRFPDWGIFWGVFFVTPGKFGIVL